MQVSPDRYVLPGDALAKKAHECQDTCKKKMLWNQRTSKALIQFRDKKKEEMEQQRP